MQRIVLIGLLVVSYTKLTFSQTEDSSSLFQNLPSLEISAYSSRTDHRRLPAALQIIQDTINYLAPLSLVNMYNRVPGVRFEERSPGSYRISVRGSTLRSPFGVRNVKVYLDGFNLTDGGGNTYIQLLHPGLLSKTELLKGPASSMYGAGTGGALLLHTNSKLNTVSVGLGSYGQWQESIHLNQQYGDWNIKIFQGHQQTKGYRQQSAMRRDLIYSIQKYESGRSSLKLMQWYGDLDYETPGGLNLEQYTKDPKQARPAAGRIPGAVEQQAGIRNKTGMVGIDYAYQLSPSWTIQPNINLWYTDFRNPFITNYEIRYEQNIAARPIIQYQRQFLQGGLAWTTGWEFARQHSLIRNFGNKKGIRDTLQSDAAIQAYQHNIFTQLQWDHGPWQLLTGLSSNQQVYDYKTLKATDYTTKESGPLLMPRISVSYSLGSKSSVYASVARGNSPPTIAEIRPSSGEYNQELLPENGWNYEVGFKKFGSRFDFNINLYHLQLIDAIVRRNDAAGIEYFVNAGGATIRGLESWTHYHHKLVDVYASLAYQPYVFDDYKQRTDDYDGHEVTGVPKFTSSIQSIFHPFPRADIHLLWSYQSKLPLNDANTIYLSSYHTLQATIAYRLGTHLKIQVSGQQIIGDQYSPGPDINAAANRYFNAGAKQEFQLGLRWDF